MVNKSSNHDQIISLPKGGGSIKGMGETFQPNLFTGTGDFSIPISTSPGRSEFNPKLTIQYSTGNGNGPFGLGWQLSIPRVTRKTGKGIPKYTDEDVFVISGAEDLVPVLNKDTGQQVTYMRGDYTVSLYRPRTEGLFARIEKWQFNTDVHWRATTKDNITNIYGRTKHARILNPDEEQHVFEWLLQETLDAKGNHILYEYVKERTDLNVRLIFERNRTHTQCYIRRILYGNTPYTLELNHRTGPIRAGTSSQTGSDLIERHYLFEVLFDYGDLTTIPDIPYSVSLPEETIPDHCPIRNDPFSTFRSGFEIRTLRLCRRVLMLHHFKELDGAPLAKSTDFAYESNADTKLSFLVSVKTTGYRKEGISYRTAHTPPVTFKYSEFKPQEQRYKSVRAAGNDVPPLSLNNPNFTLIDLFGDALPDVLQTGDTGYFFWQNLGDATLDRRHSQKAVPSGISPAKPNVAYGDMGGDGLVDIIVEAPPVSGFFEATPGGEWKPFKRFEMFPSINLSDPNARMLDLTGDGLTDILVTEDDCLLWFECLGEVGYAEPKMIARVHDLDEFPNVFFNDPSGRVRLADITGDGLNDIVMIHSGHVDYWPNLGYGRFGKRITMANAPRFEYNYDTKRLFLADLDGNGCADLVYVDMNCVHFWFNQSGNGWSEQQTILGTPYVSDTSNVQFSDFFGTGTAALVWSYDYNFQHGGNYKVLDFCGGTKPHLLTEMSNSLGATTLVKYAPSTKFYLEDRNKGEPWITNLPFPVQVVEKVEVIDHIGKTKLVTTYKYHHGYYDGREREFRGFGRVDQFDSEIFEVFTEPGLHGDEVLFNNNLRAFHMPPIEMRTWFQTGIYFDEEREDVERGPFDYRELTNKFRDEFYKGDSNACTLSDHDVEIADSPHEAFRSLRGVILRTEVYGRDGTDKDVHPYVVTQNRYAVRQLQAKNGNNHAVYHTRLLESLSYHYERNPNDPRMSHQMNLEVDDFGNVTKSAAIGCPRRLPQFDEQAQVLITYTESDFINKTDDLNFYRIGLPAQERTYELTGLSPPGDNGRIYSVNTVLDELSVAQKIHYEEKVNHSSPQIRLIEHVRTLYRRDNLSRPLPLGEVQSLALPFDSYKLAFTPGLLTQVFQRDGQPLLPNPGTVLGGQENDKGGYLNSQTLRNQNLFPPNDTHPLWTYSDEDGHWWIPIGRVFYHPDPDVSVDEELAEAKEHFFLPRRFQDPFGESTLVVYDAYDMLAIRTEDPLRNTVTSENDYRVLQPHLVTDPNGNRSKVAFDTLGMVVGTGVMGKTSENKGDLLNDSFNPNLDEETVLAHINNPLQDPHSILQKATTRLVYDLFAYYRTQNDVQPQPAVVYTLAREKHESDLVHENDEKTRIQHSFLYSDGFGREIQTKIQAEPETPGGPLRWVGSGWTIFNNKGKPVRQYEPFFSMLPPEERHRFEFACEEGVSTVLFYDPLGRVVATLHPNHTYEKVVFDQWRQEMWDVNDTLGTSDMVLLEDPRDDPHVGSYFHGLDESEFLPTWYQQRMQGNYGEAGIRAAEKALQHAATPATAYLDSLGRTFLTIAKNTVYDQQGNVTGHQNHPNHIAFDIEGNTREVRDADTRNDDNGRLIMSYEYDMLGQQLSQDSADAGKRWTLANVAGNPIRSWDSAGNDLRSTYDELQRPVSLFTRKDGGQERLVEHTVYGEKADSDGEYNLKGNIYQQYDGAGVVTNDEFDFKGNLLKGSRQLRDEYAIDVDWSPLDGLEDIDEIKAAAAPLLGGEPFTMSTEYDALNRMVKQITPDESVTIPTYNEANLLDKVDVLLHGTDERQFVTNIDYNAKGQRESIHYGNGVKTTYQYDLNTFRLTHLKSTRSTNGRPLQDLNYTYDPSGNITEIQDDAWETVFYDNVAVEPTMKYHYDALYRLIQATGREHESMTACHYKMGHKKQTEFIQLTQPKTNAQAIRNYIERYTYDVCGNLEQIKHTAGPAGSWTRDQTFEETSNRIKTSHAQCEGNSPFKFPHDPNGNITTMPHLQNMMWDYADRLVQVELDLNDSRAYYTYDTDGQRVRKVIDKGNIREERIYLGGYEIYRKYKHGDLVFERQTLHVMDDQKRIALVETRTVDTENAESDQPATRLRYQLDNHLGSSVLEVDETPQANLITYEEYYPYGGTAYLCGINEIEVKRKQYRYNGKERDDETGFYYYGARYYAPWLGRWTSVDPAGFGDGSNLYMYGASNPVCFIDPDGMQTYSESKPVYIGPQPVQYDEERIGYEVEHPAYDEEHPDYQQGISEIWNSRPLPPPPGWDLPTIGPAVDPPIPLTKEQLDVLTELTPRDKAIKEGLPPIEAEWSSQNVWYDYELKQQRDRFTADWFRINEEAKSQKYSERVFNEFLYSHARIVHTREQVYFHSIESSKQGMTNIYLRISLRTGEAYIGRARLDIGGGRFEVRIIEHCVLRSDSHVYFLLETVPSKIERLVEENWIRRAGGPSVYGGTLANRRYEVNERAYRNMCRAFGQSHIPRPTGNKKLPNPPSPLRLRLPSTTVVRPTRQVRMPSSRRK